MKIGRIGHGALGLIIALVLALSLSAAATAENTNTLYATDESGNKYYSIDDAWNAARGGIVITIENDWVRSSPLTLGKNESAIINMNGQQVRRDTTDSSSRTSNGEVFCLESGANLTLRGRGKTADSYIDRQFAYSWRDENGTIHTIAADNTWTPNVGGIITGGKSSDTGGAIQMKSGAWLTLDHVAVAGNEASEYGGAIMMDGDNCKVFLENGASIEHNYSKDDGGAIYIDGTGATVSLKGGSRIYDNASKASGCGIYVNGKNAAIVLEGNSEISKNVAMENGGGIYVNDENCTIRSDDGTGKFVDNVAAGDGGGIYVWSDGATIKNLTFTENSCGNDGGGIYFNADDCVLNGCTLRDNRAASHGGGVFCDDNNDIALKGKVTIAGNFCDKGDSSTSAKWTADDLYLDRDDWMFFSVTAYLTSCPSAGSWIGINTDMFNSSERKIGENASYLASIFFSNLSNWHVEASGTELYLKKGTRYALTVNDIPMGCYSEGETITINGTPEYPKVFKCWDASEDVAIANKNDAVTTVTMPAKDVEVTASYTEVIYNVTLTVDAPVACQPLATEGTVSMKQFHGTEVNYNSNNGNKVDIVWLTQVDGKTQTVSGNAEYGRSYSALAVLQQDLSKDIVFNQSVQAMVVYTGGDSKPANTAKVDEAGALRVYGQLISTEKAKVMENATAAVNIKKDSTLDELEKALPKTIVLNTQDGVKIASLTYPDTQLSKVTLNTPGIYTVSPTVGYDALNIDANGKTVTVTVTVVSNGVLQSPTASVSSGTYTKAKTDIVTVNSDNSISMEVSLTNNDGHATGITYTLIKSYNSGSGLTGETVCGNASYTAPIALTAPHGQKVTYILSAKATGSGYTESSSVTYTYVLDNPFTVTIHGIDTGDKSQADALYEPKVYRYHVGNSVVIGAAAVTGELFEKWDNAEGITITEDQKDDITLKVSSIQDDIELTAVYNPVITEIDITMEAPKTGEALPTSGYTVYAVSAAYDTPYDVTSLFDTITWSPEDDKAEVGVVYTAALTASASGSTMKVLLSEDPTITVKNSLGADTDATTVAQTEEGSGKKQLSLYVTFPAMTAEVEPDVPYVPLEPTDDDDKKPSLPFVDVTEDDWFYDDVVYVWEEGLMKGTSSDHFSPYMSTTRGMIVTILYRLEGEPDVTAESPFSDVAKGSYYESAVTWAAANKIALGYGDGRFGPDDCVTREQLAAILYRYAQYKGEDVSVGEDTNILSFDDALDISEYAVSAMQWAVGSGLIQGSDNRLSPAATATRSQLAAILHRYCE